MKIKRTLPRGTPYDERAIALAVRLRLIDQPTRPLSDITEEGWKRLWFAIGLELAEKQPEFRLGHGRLPGSKNKQLAPASSNTQAQRRRRERLKGIILIPIKDDKY